MQIVYIFGLVLGAGKLVKYSNISYLDAIKWSSKNTPCTEKLLNVDRFSYMIARAGS